MNPNSQRVTITEGVYEALCDYLRERQDVRDGGDGTPLPNDAMHLLFQLTEDAKRSGPADGAPSLQRIGDCLLAYYPVGHENHKFSLLFASLVYAMEKRDPNAPLPEAGPERVALTPYGEQLLSATPER